MAIQKYADAATSIVGGNLQNEAPALAADGIDITMALAKIVIASQNGQIDATQFNQLIDILKTDGPSGQAASFRIAVALGTLSDAGSDYLKALSQRMLDDYVADSKAGQQLREFIAANPNSPEAKEIKELVAQGVAMSMAMAMIGVRFYGGKLNKDNPSWNGSGPISGTIGVNANSKSNQLLLKFDREKRGSSLFFDTISATFVVATKNSPSFHRTLAAAIGSNKDATVAGMLTRNTDGKFSKNEKSGTYWQNWTPERRAEFVSTMKNYGITIRHSPGM